MKILAIMGSPKGKGDGYKIVQHIESVMKESGEIEFEYLFLKDVNLELCRGCFTCISKGEEKCPLKDERSQIEKQILSVDGVILISPGYVGNVTWLMKNFIDRFAYTHHRPRFFNQYLMLITNSGGANLKKPLKSLKLSLGGAKVTQKLAVPTPPWPISAKTQEKRLEKIEEAAKRFCETLETKKHNPSPGIYDYVYFKIYKSISAECKEYLPADHVFYEEKDAYFYDTKVGIITKIFGGLLTKLILKMAGGLAPAQEMKDRWAHFKSGTYTEQ